jgi:hypothetical protein
MRKGFTGIIANNDDDLVPSATAPAAESLMKWRRLVLFMFGDYERRFVVAIKINSGMYVPA